MSDDANKRTRIGSARAEANVPAPAAVVELDETTKALRLHDADGREVQLGLLAKDASSLLFLRYEGLVFIADAPMNPALHDVEGNCLQLHAVGTPLHWELNGMLDGKEEALVGYFTGFEFKEDRTGVRLRLVLRGPNPETRELFLEKSMEFVRVPAALLVPPPALPLPKKKDDEEEEVTETRPTTLSEIEILRKEEEAAPAVSQAVEVAA